MYLGCDLETSGLFRPDLPMTDPSQPRIVQMGLCLWDGQWNVRGEFEALIRPDGWAIEAGATEVHGITTGDCERFGVALGAALLALQEFSEKAVFIIGHNINGFDRPMVAAELHRLGSAALWWAKRGRAFRDTMEIATPYLRLAGKFGDKAPSLKETHDHLFPEEAETFTVRHRAGDDLRVTARIFRELQQRGVTQ